MQYYLEIIGEFRQLWLAMSIWVEQCQPDPFVALSAQIQMAAFTYVLPVPEYIIKWTIAFEIGQWIVQHDFLYKQM